MTTQDKTPDTARKKTDKDWKVTPMFSFRLPADLRTRVEAIVERSSGYETVGDFIRKAAERQATRCEYENRPERRNRKRK